MKAKIVNYDPTGVEVESQEFELPLVIEYTSQEGVCAVEQPDGTVIHYEPMRKNRYFLEIGDFIYKINDRTGELTKII